MRVISIYIFKEDGIPLFSRFYDEKAKKVDGLVAPFLVSTTNRMEEITGAEMRAIALAENTFLFIEHFAEIICAVVVYGQKDTELALNLVARRFYKLYRSSITGKGWTGKLDTFDDFIPEMERILGIESEMVLLSMPSMVLDPFVIADYPKHVQPVLKLLIREDEVSYDQVVKMVANQDDADQLIHQLKIDGYVGQKEYADGRISFFKLA